METAQETTTIEAGTIFVSSWGYDQTNVDFYEVVRHTKKTVWVRPIESEKTYNAERMTGTAKPIPGTFTGAPVRRKMVTWNGAIHIAAGYKQSAKACKPDSVHQTSHYA